MEGASEAEGGVRGPQRETGVDGPEGRGVPCVPRPRGRHGPQGCRAPPGAGRGAAALAAPCRPGTGRRLSVWRYAQPEPEPAQPRLWPWRPAGAGSWQRQRGSGEWAARPAAHRPGPACCERVVLQVVPGASKDKWLGHSHKAQGRQEAMEGQALERGPLYSSSTHPMGLRGPQAHPRKVCELT